MVEAVVSVVDCFVETVVALEVVVVVSETSVVLEVAVDFVVESSVVVVFALVVVADVWKRFGEDEECDSFQLWSEQYRAGSQGSGRNNREDR